MFSGLGQIVGEYILQLKGDAKNFALVTIRPISLALLSAVETELTRMQELGNIFSVDQPAEWYAGKVVIPKANNQGKDTQCHL